MGEPVCLRIDAEGIAHLQLLGDDAGNLLSPAFVAAFGGALAALPPALFGKASLANSSAIFLGTDYHFDMVRAGAALSASRRSRDSPIR